MDSHDGDHRLLMAFLAGELGPADARRWDEHLLECERCWQEVREDRAGRLAAELLRQPAPAGLADRVRFAVELAAAGSSSSQPPPRGVRRRWRRLAGAGTLALGAAVTAVVVLMPGGRASMPAAVAAVARYAETVPPPAQQLEPGRGPRAVPVEVSPPVMITAGGQRIVLRTWRLAGHRHDRLGTAQPPGPDHDALPACRDRDGGAHLHRPGPRARAQLRLLCGRRYRLGVAGDCRHRSGHAGAPARHQ